MFDNSLLYYFTDPVLRAPTIGSMLMCFSAGIVGVLVFLRKQSLLGEALSHAAYPGVILGIILAGILEIGDSVIPFLILSGAALTSLLGIWTIAFLERRFRIRSDSALCFVLSAFFGIGLTLASQVQFSFSTLYQQAQIYLYGQAATMTEAHIKIYAALSLATLITVIIFYKELHAAIFDRDYAYSLGINVRFLDLLIFSLVVLSVVIGIRSVGVVLMSAMLIAPAAAARQYTHKLSKMFVLAGIFGLLSGFLGNYLSFETSTGSSLDLNKRSIVPTGPMIVIVASGFCFLSLLFAPERGMVPRLSRILRFKYKCDCENVLKAIWRISPSESVEISEIEEQLTQSKWHLRVILFFLARNGWIKKVNGRTYRLTNEGSLWAAKIVRLHRLWEVYLADYLGVGAERVHRNAEEMEHIITPELEQELTLLLKDPKHDPHKQPIPPKPNS